MSTDGRLRVSRTCRLGPFNGKRDLNHLAGEERRERSFSYIGPTSGPTHPHISGSFGGLWNIKARAAVKGKDNHPGCSQQRSDLDV